MKKVLIAVFSILLCFGSVFCFTSCKEEQEKVKTNVDINIAAMNTTMAYSTLYDIQTRPYEYEGKTINCYIEHTILRGHIVYSNGNITDAEACGEMIKV